jgi:hypothetical protein
MIKRAFLILLVAVLGTGCASMSVEQEDLAEFTVESLAIMVGYELRGSFEMTREVQWYFSAIDAGRLDLQGAQEAEAYLSTVTHPLIANRMLRLAAMVGFDLDQAGSVIGVDQVDMRYLQVAARGLRLGLDLD